MDKARLESHVQELEKEAVSKEDCTKTGEAELRAMIEDGMKRIQHLEGVKAKRKQDLQDTQDLEEASKEKLEKRNDRHEKALNAVSRIAEVVGNLQGGGETALLEVAARAAGDADVSDSFRREDAEAIADLLARLKGHMGDAMQAYKKQHVHEKSSWASVLETQQRALRAVEGDLEQARGRVQRNKRRLAAARSGTQQCLVNARNAAHELEGVREELAGKRASCKTVEDALAREHGHRKHELVIIDKIRAIVMEKLDALGTYLRQRVSAVMNEATGGATGAKAPEAAEEKKVEEEQAEAASGATGVYGFDAKVDDVPEGAEERMPAERYTGTGTGAQGVDEELAHAEGEAFGGKVPEAQAREVAAHGLVAEEGQDALDAALSAGLDAVVAATGATGAVGDDQCHYAYTGVHGPDYWKDLCGGKWSACDSLDSGLQSPIDIKQESVTAVSGAALPANYHSVSGVNLVNTGNSLAIKGGDFGALNVDGATYHATSIQFHAASEHTFDQRHSHVEMQIVHETRVGPTRFAVVSVMLDRAPADEEASGELWKLGFSQDDKLPAFEGASMPLNAVRLGDFKDAALIGSYYRYEGSLTTPPCTRGAHWFVVKTPLRVPAAWVQAIENVVTRNVEPALGNNRPTQPLRSRDVKLVEPNVFA